MSQNFVYQISPNYSLEAYNQEKMECDKVELTLRLVCASFLLLLLLSFPYLSKPLLDRYMLDLPWN